MAIQISVKFPNIIVIGADGYVTYASTGKGGYAITGINNVQDSGKNDGTIVAYKNGIEQYRRKL